MIKLAIFDLDGTLLDTLADLHTAVNHALASEGLPRRSLEEVRRFVGNGIPKLIERAVSADCAPDVRIRVHETFTAYYKDHCADATRPYDGIPALLSALRGRDVRVAVVSNKADYAVQILCRGFFPGLYDLAVGERAGIRKKPCPDSVNEVLARLGVDRADAVYIGDSDVDVETAKNAGMPCLSVLWGFRDRDFLLAHGATATVSTPERLAELLFSL